MERTWFKRYVLRVGYQHSVRYDNYDVVRGIWDQDLMSFVDIDGNVVKSITPTRQPNAVTNADAIYDLDYIKARITVLNRKSARFDKEFVDVLPEFKDFYKEFVSRREIVD